ncbi:hypothetical protein TanjilG_19475 [Lupinus angustifolius]|uniref:MADS-box domain-containing protein n=1 Tax=Lupinus angustifolius TaxID=3871 RepID=A0A1J7HMQ6_LUPAN|nr:PREDICTED: agamous-like MADS-box protein AGL80 [Lupinus angustifolius]OIW14096.1 hypothetical protein TanjilG_19475 [Lupinus angustifolius]
MTRKKLELTYIASDSKRNATLKKRRNGLWKKINEITTLCGIEACAIISTPDDLQPEVWPSHLGVQKVLYKFSRIPEMEKSKKMFNQENFLSQSIIKAKEQLRKLRNENRKKEMSLLMFQCLSSDNSSNNVNMTNLSDLSWLIDLTLKEIDQNITKNQPQQDALVTTNGGEAMKGENTSLDSHVQGMMQITMDAMQKQNLAMDSINGSGNLMIPTIEFGLSNGMVWNEHYLH